MVAAILDFFQRGRPMILGQNFKFLVIFSVDKMDPEKTFGDVLEPN